MSFDEIDVDVIAHLARLQVDESEKEEVTRNLVNILTLVDQMQAVNTADITPMAHPTDAIQVLREDQVTESNHRDEYQLIAPAIENGLYLVPKVIAEKPKNS